MNRFGNSGQACLVAFSLAGSVAVIGVLVTLWHPGDPEVEGKRVSAWFGQLFAKECNSNNVPISYMADGAFERMTPEIAVPFLAAKLRYNPVWDELFPWLKQNRFTSRFTRRLVAPVDRRLRASSLLRIKGPAASNAVPALLIACKQDPNMRVRRECVYDLAFVLNRRPRNGGVLMSDWPEFESSTIGEAARRYPDIARRLGVTLVQTTKISEQGGSANASQPIRSETNRTSLAAGSRR